MECLTWEPEELIAVASAILKDDKKTMKKYLKEKSLSMMNFILF